MDRVSLLTQNVKHNYRGSELCYSAMETMGERIKRLREAKGWSQSELAKRIVDSGAVTSLSRVSVSYWENGQTDNIKNRTFLALVTLLGTTQEYLLFGPDRAPGPLNGGKASRRDRKV